SSSGRAASTKSSTTTSTAPRSSPPSSNTSGSPVFTPDPIDWRSCGGRLKCARLSVPLDHANPTGPRIELALNELPARKPDERIGALLLNPGGPGGSGLDFVSGGLDVA